MDYIYLRNRKKIDKYTKYKKTKISNLINSKKEKDYEYFLCDYCDEEIPIKNKKHEMSGGICIIPQTVTKKESIKVVLHNKCLINALKELEG